jgi:hypothetical protein
MRVVALRISHCHWEPKIPIFVLKAGGVGPLASEQITDSVAVMFTGPAISKDRMVMNRHKSAVMMQHNYGVK